MAKRGSGGPVDPAVKLQKSFEKIDREEKSNLENMSDEEIRAKVSELALYKQARKDTMQADPEVIRLSEALSSEKADYQDEIKGADLKIKYAKFLLESRGKL